MSLPPSTPGPRQLSIESITLQKLVEALQRKSLPQITDGVDNLSLDRPSCRIVIRGVGDDFCGWPGCASLFRIENRLDKDRAMDIHDHNHLNISGRAVSVFVPYPVKIHDRMRISAAIQVATEQGRLARLNIPSNTILSVSFWDHSIPCRHCNDLSVLDAPPQLTPLCEHPRVARVITSPPPAGPPPAPSPAPPSVHTFVPDPPKPAEPTEIVRTRTIAVPETEWILSQELKTRFDFEIANQVWEQLKAAHYHGDEARVNLKRATLKKIM